MAQSALGIVKREPLPAPPPPTLGIVKREPLPAVTMRDRAREAVDSARRAGISDELDLRYLSPSDVDELPIDEPAFRRWYAGMAGRYDLNPDPDDRQQFYDYRAAFRAGAEPDESGHWPSQFKREGHPNLVVGGFHVQTGERVPGTPRADEAELVRLGWEPATAKGLAAIPEPSAVREPDFRSTNERDPQGNPVVRDEPRGGLASIAEQLLAKGREVVTDIGISALHGAIGIPEAAIGLADAAVTAYLGAVAPTLGYKGGSFARWAEEVGIQPSLAKDILARAYSDPQKTAFANVEEAQGALNKAVAVLKNPSVIAHTVIESAPSMLGGAGVARAVVRAAGPGSAIVGGALGEGAVTAGQAAEQIRQESGGELTAGQAAIAIGSGAATSALSLFGGKLAARLGIADVDTMLAGAAVDPAARRSLVKQIVYGAAQEGFVEELPQSVQEQIAQNVATGKPLERGVDQAAVLGTFAGVVMGGGAQIAGRRQPSARPHPVATPTDISAAPPSAAPTASAPVIPVATPIEAPVLPPDFVPVGEEPTAPPSVAIVARAPLEAPAGPPLSIVERAQLMRAEDPDIDAKAKALVERARAAKVSIAHTEPSPWWQVPIEGEYMGVPYKGRIASVYSTNDPQAYNHGYHEATVTLDTPTPFFEGDEPRSEILIGLDSEAFRRQQLRSHNSQEPVRPVATSTRELSIETRQLEAAPTQPRPGVRYEIPARAVTADPASLQFRAQANREGLEAARTIEEPYDPKKGGVIAVWRDPQSGDTKVVNGHHRLAAAQRDNADVAVVYIDAPTAAEARTQGALLNIDEDHADLRDAVQLIIDGGFTKADFAKLGISQRSKVAKDAEAVASLAPGVRASWQAGELDDGIAVAIGRADLSPEQQAVVQKVYSQQAARGREMTPSQVAILARRVKAAPETSTAGQQQGSIFDVLGEERGQNLFVERAALEDWLVGQLARDKRLFGGVTKQADRLAEGGTQVDVARGQQIAAESTQAADVVRRLADVAGPVSTALNQAATRIANGENANAVRAELLYEARAAARQELGHATDTALPDASREGARDARVSDTATRGVLPDEAVDRLDTGEAQPRLPADVGAVRETERATPAEDPPQQTLQLRGEQLDPQQPAIFQSGGGSADASIGSIGDASDLPIKTGTVPTRPRTLLTEEGTSTLTATRNVEFPELVEIARDLIATPQVVKRFRKEGKLGEFSSASGRIRLHADLFKPGQERQLAATLAHEIGHLADWLPDPTLKRGNLLGRLRSLQHFLKGTFTAADGAIITNADVRRELKALSMKWRPWDPTTANPSFAAYRNSGKELYADALSVLLNNPGLLETDAPTFYRQFFEELNRKPEVKRAYFDLQTLLSGTREELIARRRAGVREMFEGGDVKAIEIQRLREAERAASQRNLGLRLRIQHVDKNVPIIDRVKDLERRGVRVPEDEDPRYFLEERNYLGGLLKAFTERHFHPVYEATQAAGIAWHDFGEALFYERILAGDRSDVANPRGITTEAARELYDDLQQSLTAEQRQVLAAQMTKFRQAVRRAAEDAYQAGLYKPELYAQMKENPAYVTFRVIDHLEQDVSSRVAHQIGTLKDVQNPADATILKTLVTIRATEYQKMKVATFKFLEQHFPEDIEQAEYVWTGRSIAPKDPPDAKKQVLVTYYEQGRLRGKYVDPFIADSLNNASVGQNWAIVAGLRWINGRWFRPVFTTLNLGFQTFNVGRDFFRFWKNTPTMTFRRAIQRYWEAVPMARVRAFGLSERPTPKQLQGYLDLVEAEEARILSTTFNDLLDGREVEDTLIEDTFARLGINDSDGPPQSAVKAGASRLLNAVKRVGDFIETLPKAAGIYEFKGQGAIADIPPAERSFIRRKIGSPDFLAGGTYKPVSNELLLFSNAITQAIRADLEVAREPKTRAGFWWKTAAMNIAPKVAIFAALYLLPDDDDWDELKHAFQGISEYDLTNYLPVPLGRDENGNTVYLRIPQDDFGRLIGGLVWKALQGARGDKDALRAAMHVFDYTAGQVPSVTPVVQLASDMATFAAGANVYDPFRNRFLFTEDELKARDSRTLSKFLGYEFQQLGGGIVWKFYPGEQRPREQTAGQRILELPVVSNVVGRWIRITNYGEVEQLREARSGVERDEARRRLDERDAVNEALREYSRLIPPKRTAAEQQRLARQVVSRLYAKEPPAKRQQEYRDVLKKIRMGAARGSADPIADAVMGATSNTQRVAVLVEASEKMGDAAFDAWLRRAIREQVISADVASTTRKQRRVRQ